MRPLLITFCAMLVAVPANAGDGFHFASIDGGQIHLSDWRGKPVMVVNTASLCAFTGQYDALQALHETYGPLGVLILAVPSDDFNQELADEAAVKEYCSINYDLTLPMTEITPVTGESAHPFYAWVAKETGFAPQWNFNKVLIGPEGAVVATWGSAVVPDGGDITGRIEALLQ